MIRFSVSVSDVSDEDATRKKTAPVEYKLHARSYLYYNARTRISALHSK